MTLQRDKLKSICHVRKERRSEDGCIDIVFAAAIE